MLPIPRQPSPSPSLAYLAEFGTITNCVVDKVSVVIEAAIGHGVSQCDELRCGIGFDQCDGLGKRLPDGEHESDSLGVYIDDRFAPIVAI